MKRSWITTGKAAERIGIHPNTLRWYEEAGYLPPVPRTGGGYRMYTPGIFLLAKIVHAMQPVLRIYGPIRRMGKRMLELCREGRTNEALTAAGKLVEFLEGELDLALRALGVLERWRHGEAPEPGQSSVLYDSAPQGMGEPLGRMVRIGDAAGRTGLTRDRIINWERNGLCDFPRSPKGSVRLFGREEIDRLLVIRSCRTAGYSVTAIRRLLRAVDEGLEAGADRLERIADTPHPDETALFTPFPTDTLPETLKGLIALAGGVRRDITSLDLL